MEQYDLSGRVAAYQDQFAHNVEDRVVPLGLATTAVECYAASLEDIVASKLYSDRAVDASDVRRRQLLHNYDVYLKEFGPCES